MRIHASGAFLDGYALPRNKLSTYEVTKYNSNFRFDTWNYQYRTMPPFSTRPRPAAPRASYMYNRHRTRVTGASVVSNAIRSVLGGAYFSAFCILRIFDPLCVLRIACCVLRTGQPSLTRISVLRIAYCVFTYPFLPALRTQYAIRKPCQTVLRNTQKAASIRNWSIRCVWRYLQLSGVHVNRRLRAALVYELYSAGSLLRLLLLQQRRLKDADEVGVAHRHAG